MKEYWKDFDLENKLKEDAKNFKFLDLEDPFLAAYDKENKDFDKLMKSFSPEHPPVLENYNELSEKYKLPSKFLLNLEKEHYRKYIKKLRHVNKILVRQAKNDAKIAARKFLQDKMVSIKNMCEEEGTYIQREYLKMKKD